MKEQLIENIEVKDYCEKFKLEGVLNETVNKIILSYPPDPFAQICANLKQYSSDCYVIDSIAMGHKLNSDFSKTLSLDIFLGFKGVTRYVYTYPIPHNDINREKFDGDCSEIVAFYKANFGSALENFSFEAIEDIDSHLMGIYNSLPNEQKSLAHLLMNALSLSIFYSMSLLNEDSFPMFIRKSHIDFELNNPNVPNLGFSIFKTGKSMNSKVKFERFMIIINNQSKLKKEELIDIIQKLYAALKKNLTAGKQGENGLKLNNEGSYFPPSDNLNDILKFLEGVISEVGFPEVLKIGIDCNANNFYVESEQAYEMDGFKKNPDAGQLMEFYVKLLSDHPLIEFLEDPFCSKDEDSFFKLYNKLQSEKPNVKLSSKISVATLNNIGKNIESEPIAQNSKLVLTTSDVNAKIANTEQPKKKEEDEEESSSMGFLSIKLDSVLNCSHILKIIQYMNNKATAEDNSIAGEGLNLWDFDVETNQSVIINLGLGIKANYIFLNGLTLKDEKMSKIREYIDNIAELYN